MTIESLKSKIEEHGMITHAGSYHADDVLSTVLINILINDGEIDPYELDENSSRFVFPSRITSILENSVGDAFVYDIGGGKFDHHQVTADRRINGEKYSAIGLIWREFGHKFVKSQLGSGENRIVMSVFNSIDRYFQYIDLTDNVGLGEAFNNISASISSMSQYGIPFEKAVKTVAPLLISFMDLEIQNGKQMLEAAKIADQTQDDYYVIPDDEPYIPAKVFYGTHLRFIVSKSNRVGYNVNAVPGNKIEFERDDLPGCTFLHTGKFMAVFDTKENALKAAEKIVAKK